MMVPQNLKVKLRYNTAFPLMDINPKERKAGTHADTCKPIFISVLTDE